MSAVALVVGGGVAGMTAALSLAQQGYPVHLMEKSEILGGNARRLHQTYKDENIGDFVKESDPASGIQFIDHPSSGNNH